MPPQVRRHGDTSTRPYVVRWQLMIPGCRDVTGELSAHKRPDLAIAAAIRSWKAISDLWGGDWPWFRYTVVDRRSGEIIKIFYR